LGLTHHQGGIIKVSIYLGRMLFSLITCGLLGREAGSDNELCGQEVSRHTTVGYFMHPCMYAREKKGFMVM
jgi:hypothetical protein